MSIDWSKAPEGATHAAFSPDIQQHIFFKFADDRWFDVKNKEWSYVGGKPNFDLIERPKTLTQAVFNGLSSEYRWAAVDRDGDCFVFGVIPEELDGYGWGCEHGTPSHYIGENFDATDWENSLIEREESITDVARSIEAARQVEATLAERQNQYGDFKDVAHLSQGLQSLLSVGNFSDTQQEAIQMICSKLARLACGDADHVDSWHDIAGYATLVVKDLESGK
jgi:hypothetical protein